MKLCLAILFVCMLAGSAYADCGCTEIKHKADCDNEETKCKWETDKCTQMTCASMTTEPTCENVRKLGYPQEDGYRCQWDTTCVEYSGCSAALGTTVELCAEKGCFWKADTKCQDPTCADFVEATCNGNEDGNRCFFDTTCKSAATCAEITKETSCSYTGGKSCEWTTACIEKVQPAKVACTTMTTAETCTTNSASEGARCVWGTACYEASKCADRMEETNCTSSSCFWDTAATPPACGDQTCKSSACTKATVLSSGDNWKFCKFVTPDCVDGVANDLGDACYKDTYQDYSWDGTNCTKCSSKGGSSSAYLMSLFAMIVTCLLA